MDRCARKANSVIEMDRAITTITTIFTIFQTGIPAAAIATV